MRWAVAPAEWTEVPEMAYILRRSVFEDPDAITERAMELLFSILDEKQREQLSRHGAFSLTDRHRHPWAIALYITAEREYGPMLQPSFNVWDHRHRRLLCSFVGNLGYMYSYNRVDPNWPDHIVAQALTIRCSPEHIRAVGTPLYPHSPPSWARRVL
jgi:hypothetical protein